MSCPNFIKYHARNYNVVSYDIDEYRELYGYDVDNALYDIINEDYEDVCSSVADFIKRNSKELFGGKAVVYKRSSCPIDFDRSYGGRYLCSVERVVNDKYTIDVHVCSCCGYCSGMTLDYVIEIHNNILYRNSNGFYSLDYEDVITDDLDCCKNKSVLKLARRIGSVLEDKVFQNFITDKLVLKGMFSNGEGVYERID